jgi:hypothetical protein
LQEGFCCGFGVFRRVDRTADDKVVGAGAEGILGRRDPRLIASVAAW